MKKQLKPIFDQQAGSLNQQEYRDVPVMVEPAYHSQDVQNDSEEKRFCIVRVSHIIAEGPKYGEEDQVLDIVKETVHGMHQVVQDPRKMREGKGLEMFLSGKAIHQIDLRTY